MALHVVKAPGARVVDGQVIADKPGSGSVMRTAVNVTLPSFNTRNENVCVSPSDAPVGEVSVVIATDLVSVTVFVCAIGVVVDELFDVTAGPLGGVALADAVLMTNPAFTSACVIVRVALQVVDAPGARVIDGQVIADKPGSGSETPTEVRVTLPVLVTTNENVCVSPNDAPSGVVSVVIATDLVNASVFAWLIGVAVDEAAEFTAGPDGGVPLAVAVLLIEPALTSAWVMVRVAVQVVEAPGARIVAGQVMADNPGSGSVMATAVKVTLPVFVTANENVCTSPSDAPVGAVSVVIATVLVSVIVFV